MYISLRLISWNSFKICEEEVSRNYDRKKMNTKENQVFSLLLIEYIFSKKNYKAKHETKKERMGYALVECRRPSAFNNIFAELIVKDKRNFVDT